MLGSSLLDLSPFGFDILAVLLTCISFLALRSLVQFYPSCALTSASFISFFYFSFSWICVGEASFFGTLAFRSLIHCGLFFDSLSGDGSVLGSIKWRTSELIFFFAILLHYAIRINDPVSRTFSWPIFILLTFSLVSGSIYNWRSSSLLTASSIFY